MRFESIEDLADSYTFPLYEVENPFETAPAPGKFVELPDGMAFDPYGSGPAPSRAYTITKRFRIVEDSGAAMQASLDHIKAFIGRRAKLQVRMDDGSTRRIYARVTQVTATHEHKNMIWQDVDVSFEIVQPGWLGIYHDGPWLLDDGHYFDEGLVFDEPADASITAGTQYVDLDHAGNRAVANVLFRVVAGDVAITAVTLRAATGPVGSYVDGEYELTYSGTVAAGALLRIDCGAKAVLNAGVADFAHLARGANHKHTAWWSVGTVRPAVKITLTGGGTGAHFRAVYSEGWA